MTRKFTILSSAGLSALLVAASAQAQEEVETALPPPDQTLIEEQGTEQVLSSDLIGADVMHPQHGEVGTLDMILFDDRDRIVGGVVAIGGFLGMGTKEVALSWDAFDVQPDEPGVVYINLTADQLEAAPSFKDLETIIAEREAERLQQEMEAQQQQTTY